MNIDLIQQVESLMAGTLNNVQLERLHNVLIQTFGNEEIKDDEKDYLTSFIAAKRVEGCSDKTIRYYQATIKTALDKIGKSVKRITTDDLRGYIDSYQQESGASRVTVDNIRRILSSFFTWLETEDHIMRNPMKRIHKVKTGKAVKETYSDEDLEVMRDGCDNIRDLAMIDVLASTGIRVGELVTLNRDDIDFENRECIVLGKGNKERRAYFDARTKIHLQQYLNGRDDDNPALIVSLQKPHERLQISGVEIRLRELGKRLSINRVHPHKFRRTLATVAIDKGMPIEQVQQLLGHQSIDTTLQYAMVNQANVKSSHRRFIG